MWRYFCYCILFMVLLLLSTAFCSSRKESSGISNCKSGWVQQNRKPSSNNLKRITFSDAQTGWITGEGGIVLQSKDGGKNWNFRDDLFLQDISDIVFIDDQNYCAIKSNNEIHITNDSGKSWKLTFRMQNYRFDDFQCVGGRLFMVCRYTEDNSDKSDSIVLRSPDKGKTWEEIFRKKGAYEISVSAFKPEKVVIWNGDDSLSGNNVQGVYHFSNDGGNLWIKKSTYKIESIQAWGGYNSMFFFDNQYGWIVIGCEIFFTNNGGDTWQYSNIKEISDRKDILQSVNFFNKNDGIIAGSNRDNGSILRRTTDGGKTWRNITGFKHIYHLNDIYLKTNGEGWVVGESGAILYTKDYGKSWRDLTDGTTSDLTDVDFSDKNNGWAAGGTLSSEWRIGGTILKTNDGGKNWTESYYSLNTFLVCVKAIDKDHIVAAGAYLNNNNRFTNGLVLISSDGGQHWTEKPIGKLLPEPVNISRITDIENTENNVFWVIGTKVSSGKPYPVPESSALFCSTDFFKTIQKKQELPVEYEKIKFPDNNNGFAYGFKGCLETRDRGNSWQAANIDGENNLCIYDMFFVNKNEGWVLASYVKKDKGFLAVYKTEDLGKNWKKVSTKNWISNEKERENLNRIYFSDSNTGWITGLKGDCFRTIEGIIFKTTDGGKTWKQQTSGTANNLNKIFFIDEKTGWIVGDFGTILFTNTGGE